MCVHISPLSFLCTAFFLSAFYFGTSHERTFRFSNQQSESYRTNWQNNIIPINPDTPDHCPLLVYRINIHDIHDKQLQVKINNSLSYAYEASSGVPQGSHLGPVLFLIFINDVSYTFNNVKFLLFADDLKLFREVGNSQDAVILQNNFLGVNQLV